VFRTRGALGLQLHHMFRLIIDIDLAPTETYDGVIIPLARVEPKGINRLVGESIKQFRVKVYQSKRMWLDTMDFRPLGHRTTPATENHRAS